MRRGIIVAVIALWCALFAAACQAEGIPEILHERIAVALDPAAHLLTAESTVTLNPHGAASLSFALHPGATVLHVSVEGEDVPVAFSGGTLVVGFSPEA